VIAEDLVLAEEEGLSEEAGVFCDHAFRAGPAEVVPNFVELR
jgi:hypothetical protein